jgi:hypothetical protein
MTSWYNPSRQNFQPKRQFRFVVEFPTFASDTTYMVTKVTKPSFEMAGDTEHRILNHTFKFPGIIKWSDIDISFIDALEPNVGSKFYNVLKNMGYLNPTSLDNLHAGITKTSAQSALGEIRILQLDAGAPILSEGARTDAADETAGMPSGVKWVEQWKLHNAFLKTVKFGDLSYDSDDIVNIDIGITYDYATYIPGGEPGDGLQYGTPYPIQG